MVGPLNVASVDMPYCLSNLPMLLRLAPGLYDVGVGHVIVLPLTLVDVATIFSWPPFATPKFDVQYIIPGKPLNVMAPFGRDDGSVNSKLVALLFAVLDEVVKLLIVTSAALVVPSPNRVPAGKFILNVPRDVYVGTFEISAKNGF